MQAEGGGIDSKRQQLDERPRGKTERVVTEEAVPQDSQRNILDTEPVALE